MIGSMITGQHKNVSLTMDEISPDPTPGAQGDVSIPLLSTVEDETSINSNSAKTKENAFKPLPLYVKIKRFFHRENIKVSILLIVFFTIWFLPVDEATMSLPALHMLATFCVTILALLLKPYGLENGPVTLIGIMILVVSRTITIKQGLSGFSSTTTWVMVAALLIADSIKTSGLGTRLALWLIYHFGKTPLGLGYSLAATELILGPVVCPPFMLQSCSSLFSSLVAWVPSCTARGAGTILPIVVSLAEAQDSHPNHRAREGGGEYFVLTACHCNLISSAMFLTGMGANVLVSTAAHEILDVEFGWGTWLISGFVPGVLDMALVPLVLFYFISRPKDVDTQKAREIAHKRLQKMSKFSRKEMKIAIIFLVLVVFWATNSFHHLGVATITIMGMIIMICAQAVSWDEMISNKKAWDGLIWLGCLMTLAEMLNELGTTTWVAGLVEHVAQGLSGLPLTILLALIYFYSMYAFSMLSGHVAALCAAFFSIGKALAAPAHLLVCLLAPFGTLCACLTNYSTGPTIIYFNLNYVRPRRWFVIGFIVSILHIFVWLVFGGLWWKLLGWW